MTNKISTGAEFFDNYLRGGYEKNVVTTIYGPSGSGKTNLCLLAAVKVAEQGKKVILVDTEGGVAVERIKQLSASWETVLDQIIFFQPLNFEEQQEIFAGLKDFFNNEHNNIGLIVVDSISMLYRLELGKSEAIFETNSALARQIASLVEIARSRDIPVLITNQVYADFNERDKVKMVGGDLLKYGSKCLIELLKRDVSNSDYDQNERVIVLKKHRSLPAGEELKFKIINNGIAEF
ncbi:MAG: DNA repair and recombination protein RadB [Nanoarchaeota archaeon]|nr:DNA repair and recombination protein RadB [Nanoarchaeota archaeon]